MDSTSKKTKRPVKRLPETRQKNLFSRPTEHEEQSVQEVTAPTEFVNPSPDEIFIGDTSLKDFLDNSGLGWVSQLRNIIEQSDLEPFYRNYSAGGRRPFHPAMMLGLIFYGILQKQWSLRELEMLSKRDVGAWWVCGGQHPDHSTIGRFINLHREVLTQDYFVSLTRQLVSQLRVPTDTIACDGTVVEAAASAYSTISEEAAKLAAATLKKKSEKDPSDQKAKSAADLADKVAQAATKRADVKRYYNRDPRNIRVSKTEPESVVQKNKKGGFSPSYKPSIASTKGQIIVGFDINPSDEMASVEPILQQCNTVTGQYPDIALFDAGYHNTTTFKACEKYDVDILCPAGSQRNDSWKKQVRIGKKFLKNDFVYDELADAYICPANQKIPRQGMAQDRYQVPRIRYQKSNCNGCELRELCTTSKYGRTIYRYEIDEYKEAMELVLRNEKARLKYNTRKQMVEPVYASIKNNQLLTRFRRRGQKNVEGEFALHCIAHNLKKALRALFTSTTGLLRPLSSHLTLQNRVQQFFPGFAAESVFR